MKDATNTRKINFADLRAFENMHIVLWLIKDTCWALEFKAGGIIMIIPTISMAAFLTFKSKRDICEFLHSVAVLCWILANSVWMLGEFFNHDTRFYAAVLFIIGLSSIAIYYLLYFRKYHTDKTTT